jgi:8-oxo-dGTP pyrophosphatase MutT (NUDIX family)
MDAINTAHDISNKSAVVLPSLIKSTIWTHAQTRKLCDQSSEIKLHKTTSSSKHQHRLIIDTPFSARSTVSYGLMVYAKDTKRWAIIQRKHSVEFLLFIRGLYRLSYLPFLLTCITSEEAKIIESCLTEGPNVFRHLYLVNLKLNHEGLQYALIRMAESRNIVSVMLPHINANNTNQLSWSWPKGRLHISSERETPFDCAKREFIEETEIDLPQPLFISDTYISETFKTLTGRVIESRYWIYVIPEEIPMSNPIDHPEVSTRIWADIETCAKLLNNKPILTQLSEITSKLE